MSETTPSPKKLYIKTWGCQMNVYDSARMTDVVKPLGFTITDNMLDADLVLFNTCHIREKATEKLFSELGRLHEIQKERAKKGEKILIGVTGCVAQAEGAVIQERAPYVDMVFGPQTYHQLPQMIAQLVRGARRVLNTAFEPEAKFDALPAPETNGAISSYLSIQEGCDKFCSYCVVPYTRGAEYARPMADVIKDARHLAANGTKEIILLGQIVNAYKTEEGSFAALLQHLATIDGIERLRYVSPHPCHMTDDLIAAHRDIPQLMPLIHLPVQSGSNKILTAMNRKHTSDDYRRLVDKLRAARSDIAFSSDFIVGFPGETTKDFEDTLSLVRDIGYTQAFSFKYSRRPGTPAASLSPQIKEDVKDARLNELQALLREQQDAFNKSFIGKKVPVLFETKGFNNGQIRGKTPYLQTIHVQAPERLIGHTSDVTIEEIATNSLFGSVEVL